MILTQRCDYFDKIVSCKTNKDRSSKMIKRKSFIVALTLAITCIATSLFAAHPCSFNRRHVPPGWAVCNKCNGAGCVVRNWLGITKRCEKCNGLGVRKIVRNTPVPPVFHHGHKHHHPKPKMNTPHHSPAKHNPPKKNIKHSSPHKGGKMPSHGKGRR
jgi:hypothetical protein